MGRMLYPRTYAETNLNVNRIFSFLSTDQDFRKRHVDVVTPSSLLLLDQKTILDQGVQIFGGGKA